MTAAQAATARLTAAAGRYAALGWAVLPLHTPTREGVCSCRRAVCDAPGKHPRTRGGLSDAATDPATVAGWWARWPDANIGVATGARSRLVVVDVDGAAGTASLAALQAANGPLPATRQQATARGCHLLFAHPGGRIPNSAGKLGEGLDVRADGGFIVAAPSLHHTSHRYTWSLQPDHRQVARLPGWLHQLLRPTPAAYPPTAQRGSARCLRVTGAGYAVAALTAEFQRVASAREGSRNQTLRDAAISLGTLVGAGVLHADEVAAQLAAAAAQAGLPAHEAAATVRSGLTYGQARPRTLTTRQAAGAGGRVRR